VIQINRSIASRILTVGHHRKKGRGACRYPVILKPLILTAFFSYDVIWI
jgi:hypothetical protein